MKRKGNKKNLNLTIDLINFEKEKLSVQAMGNILGGLEAICDCKDYDGYQSTNRSIM